MTELEEKNEIVVQKHEQTKDEVLFYREQQYDVEMDTGVCVGGCGCLCTCICFGASTLAWGLALMGARSYFWLHVCLYVRAQGFVCSRGCAPGMRAAGRGRGCTPACALRATERSKDASSMHASRTLVHDSACIFSRRHAREQKLQ